MVEEGQAPGETVHVGALAEAHDDDLVVVAEDCQAYRESYEPEGLAE